jgi:predicted RNase H-like HicB family nuclease
MPESMKLEIVLKASDKGGYDASAPFLPGCTTHGMTVEEALENMKKEIKIYMEGLMQEVLSKAKKDGLV